MNKKKKIERSRTSESKRGKPRALDTLLFLPTQSSLSRVSSFTRLGVASPFSKRRISHVDTTLDELSLKQREKEKKKKKRASVSFETEKGTKKNPNRMESNERQSMPAAAPGAPPHASVAASLAELAAAMQAEWQAAISGGARRASGGGAEAERGGDDNSVRSAVARCVRALADATAAEQTTADGGRPVDVRSAAVSVFLRLVFLRRLSSTARSSQSLPSPPDNSSK